MTLDRPFAFCWSQVCRLWTTGWGNKLSRTERNLAEPRASIWVKGDHSRRCKVRLTCVRLKKECALEIRLSGRESICEALGSVPSSEEIKCQLTCCTVMLANRWERKSCNLLREGYWMPGLYDWLKEEVGCGREGGFMSVPFLKSESVRYWKRNKVLMQLGREEGKLHRALWPKARLRHECS